MSQRIPYFRWPIVFKGGLAIAFALIFGMGSASADFIFNLDTGNTAISGYTGPYAKVDVHLDSGTEATITFTSLTKSGNIFLMGGAQAVDVNVNATSWTLGSVTGGNSGTGFTPGPYSDSGAKNVNGFGVLNQTIDSFDGFTHSADSVSFTLTRTDSGTWSGDTNVLAANSNNALAAAHIFVTSSPADASNGALATGFAAGNGGGPGPPVTESPAPPSVVLLGFGGLGLAIVLARSRRRLAAAV